MMWHRHMLALLAKDFRLHGREIALLLGSLLAFVGLAGWTRPVGAGSLMSLAFNLNFLAAMYWGEWLVSREKVKGTFGWLRTLPISDGVLTAEKFVAHAICCLSLWTLTSVLFAREAADFGGIDTWCVVQLGLLAFGALSVASRWRFHQKLGQVLPAIILGGLLGLFMFADRSGSPVTRAIADSWNMGHGKLLAGLTLAALYLGICFSTAAWVRRTDTWRFLE
jgi:hypothetical protein